MAAARAQGTPKLTRARTLAKETEAGHLLGTSLSVGRHLVGYRTEGYVPGARVVGFPNRSSVLPRHVGLVGHTPLRINVEIRNI